MKEDEMGRACGMLGSNEKCIQIFYLETGREETTWKS
jgi:hypothetical protein